MIDTTQDILNLVLALTTILLTSFLLWMLYHLGMILKKFHAAVSECHRKIEAVDEILKTVKEKVSSSAVLFAAVTKALTQLAGIIKARQEKKKRKS